MEIEVSLKVRSAIKAKLLELGVHVDEELPDYVMILVANRRTKAQMEADLSLFLGDNTQRFTTWLQVVLKKLDEVTASSSAAITPAPPPVTASTSESKPETSSSPGKHASTSSKEKISLSKSSKDRGKSISKKGSGGEGTKESPARLSKSRVEKKAKDEKASTKKSRKETEPQASSVSPKQTLSKKRKSDSPLKDKSGSSGAKKSKATTSASAAESSDEKVAFKLKATKKLKGTTKIKALDDDEEEPKKKLRPIPEKSQSPEPSVSASGEKKGHSVLTKLDSLDDEDISKTVETILSLNPDDDEFELSLKADADIDFLMDGVQSKSKEKVQAPSEPPPETEPEKEKPKTDSTNEDKELELLRQKALETKKQSSSGVIKLVREPGAPPSFTFGNEDKEKEKNEPSPRKVLSRLGNFSQIKSIIMENAEKQKLGPSLRERLGEIVKKKREELEQPSSERRRSSGGSGLEGRRDRSRSRDRDRDRRGDFHSRNRSRSRSRSRSYERRVRRRSPLAGRVLRNSNAHENDFESRRKYSSSGRGGRDRSGSRSPERRRPALRSTVGVVRVAAKIRGGDSGSEEEYDPSKPSVTGKLASVVKVTDRPKRSNMANNNLLFKAVKEAEKSVVITRTWKERSPSPTEAQTTRPRKLSIHERLGVRRNMDMRLGRRRVYEEDDLEHEFNLSNPNNMEMIVVNVQSTSQAERNVKFGKLGKIQPKTLSGKHDSSTSRQVKVKPGSIQVNVKSDATSELKESSDKKDSNSEKATKTDQPSDDDSEMEEEILEIFEEEETDDEENYQVVIRNDKVFDKTGDSDQEDGTPDKRATTEGDGPSSNDSVPSNSNVEQKQGVVDNGVKSRLGKAVPDRSSVANQSLNDIIASKTYFGSQIPSIGGGVPLGALGEVDLRRKINGNIPWVPAPQLSYGLGPSPLAPSVQICKFWPECTFKDKCLYTHPPCKFGYKCTKIDCIYKHPADVTRYLDPSMSMSSGPALGKDSFEKPVGTCMFLEKCHTLNCPYFHPTPCRFGLGCTDPKCKNSHPGVTVGQTRASNARKFGRGSGYSVPPAPRHLLKWVAPITASSNANSSGGGGAEAAETN